MSPHDHVNQRRFALRAGWLAQRKAIKDRLTELAAELDELARSSP